MSLIPASRFPMISDRTLAILTLTMGFQPDISQTVKPLSVSEYNVLAAFLMARQAAPENLLAADSARLLTGWSPSRISAGRLLGLLQRRAHLEKLLEAYQKRGIWVINRSEPVYPAVLKENLKQAAPVVLFGSGDRELLLVPALGIVGSRNAPPESLEQAYESGRLAAARKMAVVSGAARGCDEQGMLGALQAGGQAIGVLPDSLAKRLEQEPFKQFIQKGQLTLVSQFAPEASFSAGNAMARNKLIYCLSRETVVIHSGLKGGTWEGARENLKQGWTPVSVYRSTEPAHAALVAMGARWHDESSQTVLKRDGEPGAQGRLF